jgi:phosphoglycerate dehydrogenase-like enzyme
MALHVLIGEDVGEANLARLRARFPEVEFSFAPTTAGIIANAANVSIIFTKGLPAEAVAAARELVWVQAGTAGVEHLLRNGLDSHPAVLTNARGAHGIPMAEHILAMMFALANRVPDLVLAQPGRRRVGDRARREKWELEGQTIGIIGLSDVGSTLARKCKALGLRVLGVRRSATPFPGIDGVFQTAALDEVLPQLDHLALCLPATPETQNLIGAAQLARLKPTACVYNVGRGGVLDHDALIAALRDGRIAGAGLDVSTPEPLPDDSPLWNLPNVILGQHSSGHSPFNHDRITTIFADNLERFRRGDPLENVIDRARGY